MAQIRTIQNAMTAGEWSPRLNGRSDLDKYRHALQTCENAYPFKHGGATRRPGTRYVAEVKTSSLSTRIVGFEHSAANYVLEFGNLYIRFYREGAQIESSPGVPLEKVTTYLTADLFNLQFVATESTLYIVHPSYAPMQLTRTSHTVWSFGVIPFHDGPYLPVNETAITLTPGAATGATTLTASSATFLAGHVGSIWRLKVGANPDGYVVVTGFTSTTVVNVTVIETLTAAAATAVWSEGAFSDVRGYPGAVTLYQQRLVFGGSTYKPNTIWGSQIGRYEDFDPGTVLANEAYTYTLASAREIQWLAAHRSLVVGAKNVVMELDGGGVGEPITPLNPPFEHFDSAYGTRRVQPVNAHSALLFVERSGVAVRELVYDGTQESFAAPDITVLSEHITGSPFAPSSGVVQMAYQQAPNSIVWAVLDNGQIISCTYERPNDVVAWARHITGPLQDMTDGRFESVAAIQNSGGKRDEVWLVVKRTVNGATKRFVEYFDEAGGLYGSALTTKRRSLNVDCAVVYNSTATATIPVAHLTGETVDIVGDGLVFPQQAVAAGAVTGIDPTVTQAESGLPFPTDILTMRPEIALSDGTMQGRLQRVIEATARVHETLAFTLNGDLIDPRLTTDDLDDATPLFSGDYRALNLGTDREGRVRIQQTQPLPLTVLAIIATIEVEGA